MEDITTTGESFKPEQTYAYEVDSTSEELLKIKQSEMKDLRIKAEKDKRYRIIKVAEKRAIRDDNIDRINLKLKTIRSKMVYYNRAGKIEKSGIDILGEIYNLIKNDVELVESIDRGKTEVTKEDMEAEAVDEDEVSFNEVTEDSEIPLN